MRLAILSVGRAKRGPETDLFDIYAGRIEVAGRALAIGPLAIEEVAQCRKPKAVARRRQEGDAIAGRVASGGQLILLEERGQLLNSAQFAKLVGVARDTGVPQMTFAIGGPDGFSDELRARSDKRIAFGKMTMAHGLARLVLAEQIYRGADDFVRSSLSPRLTAGVGLEPVRSYYAQQILTWHRAADRQTRCYLNCADRRHREPLPSD